MLVLFFVQQISYLAANMDPLLQYELVLSFTMQQGKKRGKICNFPR